MRIGRSKRYGGVLAAVACLVLAGCGGGASSSAPEDVSGPRWGGSLVVALPDDVAFFNDNYDAESRFPYVAPNLFSRLVNYDYPTSTIFGDLATKWEVSADGTTYTFDLRDGVKWHDGKPFTADDVVFTYQSILDEGAKATTYSLYKDIKQVRALAPNKVEFTLAAPSSVFLTRLADYYGAWVLPKHLFSDGDPRKSPANQKPVGTGPFKFVEKVAGDHITLERNTDYFGQVPYVEKLIFRTISNRSTALAALKSGEIQYSSASPAFAEVEALKKDKRLKVDVSPSEIFQWMNINVERPIVSDVRVRKALALAINTEELNKVVYHGLAVPGRTIFRSDSWAADKAITQPGFDPEAAKKLLDEAGYPVKSDGTRFTLNYTTWNTSIVGGPELAQVVKQQLKVVGIDVKIETNDFSLYNERVRQRHDFDLNASGGLHGPDPDAWSTFFTSNSSRNDGQFKNAELDELFAKGRIVQTKEERSAVYKRVQEILADQLPRINLAEYVYVRPYSATAHDFWWHDIATEKQAGQDMYHLVWLSSGSTQAPEGLK